MQCHLAHHLQLHLEGSAQAALYALRHNLVQDDRAPGGRLTAAAALDCRVTGVSESLYIGDDGLPRARTDGLCSVALSARLRLARLTELPRCSRPVPPPSLSGLARSAF